MNIIERVSDDIIKYGNTDHDMHPFYLFEPWDVEKRSEHQLKMASDDGIDLFDADFIKHAGTDPHPFQAGYLMSKKPIRILIGGSQIGKSISPRMEIMMMCTGEVPYALRYKKGVDSGVPRLQTKENIIRWGRRDIITGEIIDHNWKATKDGKAWNCGNVIGVGIWPRDKIAPNGSQIWIGTFHEALTNYWWPSVAENVDKEYPDDFVDVRKGNKGTNKNDGIIFTQRDCRIKFLTYEQGHKKFEAKKAWTYIADEEMPSSSIWASAQDHSHSQSIVMTPLNGITWSKNLLLPNTKNPEAEVFHATQYDSPYQDNEEVDARRRTQEQWQRAARVWGQYAEQRGEPYYDRKKLNAWIHKYRRPYYLAQYAPTEVYYGIRSRPEITPIPGLMATNVSQTRIDTEETSIDEWRIYEDLKPGVGYLLSADLAEGAPTPEEAGDMSAAIISRNPIGEEEKKPVIVATIRSTQEILPFARTCSYAMRYYNNALLASETGRGSANTAFQMELDDWPHWFHTTVMRNSTGKAREKKGFDINQSSRDMIFELIGDWIGDFDDNEYPCIPDEPLLKELAASIVNVTAGGKKRCDHPRDGTLDTTIAFGIMCYVYKECSNQIKCNVADKPRQRFSRFQTANPDKALCGMSSMGYKENM